MMQLLLSIIGVICILLGGIWLSSSVYIVYKALEKIEWKKFILEWYETALYYIISVSVIIVGVILISY